MFWGSKKSGFDYKPGTKSSIRQEQKPAANARPPASQPVKPTPNAAVRRPPVARDDLPRFLVAEGHISEKNVRHALKQQQETGVFFGEILAKEGVLGDQSLVSFLAKHCKIPHIGLLDYLIDKELFKLIPPELCWKYHLLPVDKMGRNLTVAMVNPLNHAALQAIRELCPDLQIKPILCSHNHFETVAERIFGHHGDHDETTWADVPMASVDLLEANAPTLREAPTTTLPKTANKKTIEAAPEQISEVTPPDVNKHEQDAATPPAPATEIPSAHDAADTAQNNLLDSIFGDIAIPGDTTSDTKSALKSPLTPAEMTSLEFVMHSYTDAMVNSMHDTYELLTRKIKFFNGLTPEDVAKIFSQGKVVEYEQAEMLFDKGDSGDIMYVILNGRVKIRDGSKQIAILHTGDIFGEMALVSDKPRSATAVTMTQSDLLQLSFDDITSKMPTHVAVQLLANIIVTLAERLRLANQLK